MNVWETQHRLWGERLKRLLEHEDEEVARAAAAAAYMLLVQHTVNERGQCRYCARPARWSLRRRTCTVHSALLMAMNQPFHMVRGWVEDY